MLYILFKCYEQTLNYILHSFHDLMVYVYSYFSLKLIIRLFVSYKGLDYKYFFY